MASNFIECKDCGHIRLDHKGAKTGGKCEKKNCNCKGFAATYKQIKNPATGGWIKAKAVRIHKGKLEILR